MYRDRPSTSLTATTVLITVFLLVLSVGLFEIVLRAWKPFEFPFHNVLYPYVEFRAPSNVSWRSPDPSPSSRSGDHSVEYSNQDSLRIPFPNYQLDQKKPTGQIRIGVIGGSTVRIGTAFDLALPGALKRILHKRYPSAIIEVINGGITSAIARQELVFLITTLVDYQIDMLVVYDGINDSGQMLYYERRPNCPYNYKVIEQTWHDYVSDKKNSIFDVLLKRSAILRALWPGKYGNQNILNKVVPTDLINDEILRREYSEAYIENWEKIKRVCGAYGIEPIFVLQPTSLYGIFPNGSPERIKWTPTHDYLYANYLVYEDFRREIRKFAEHHAEVTVRDLSSFLPLEAFFDGAHVYDDFNDVIAVELEKMIAPKLQVLLQRKGQVGSRGGLAGHPYVLDRFT